jgi:hypothetical protein
MNVPNKHNHKSGVTIVERKDTLLKIVLSIMKSQISEDNSGKTREIGKLSKE